MIETKYRPWFERFPDRFASETKILEDAGFVRQADVFQSHQQVAFAGRLPVDPERELLVAFTDAFPSMPPLVYDKAPAKLLPRHHHPRNRQLCLFGPGSKRWTANLTSREVLAEVTTLIQDVSAAGDTGAADMVPEPLSSVLFYAPDEAILVPPNISGVESLGTEKVKGTLTMLHMPRNRMWGSGRGVVVAATIGSHALEAKDQYRELLGHGTQEVTAPLIFLPAAPTVETLDAALRDCVKADIYGKKKKLRWFAFVFPEQSGSASRVRYSWVFAKVNEQMAAQWVRTFPYRTEERMARIRQLSAIQPYRVALVGCGCLGSKIAVNLASSGVSEFGLIDFESVEPYNSVRQEYGVDSFGLRKVDVLERRIRQINPEISVRRIPFCVGEVNVEAHERDAFEMLASASLIVDTVGSHGVSRWLNDISRDFAVPIIFASVTNGAWGGEIVRSVPGHSACWRCWNEQYYDSRPPAEPSDGFFAPGCNQPTFTGTTYDAEMVASIATSVIVDTLLARTGGTSQYDGDYVRWSGRNENGPLLKAEILPINGRTNCPFCGRES